MSDDEDEYDAEDMESKVTCPICKTRKLSEALASEGVILTGCKALVEGDAETLLLLQDTLTAFDAHTAISMLTGALHDLSHMVGMPLEEMLEQYRGNVNRATYENTDG